MRRQAQHNAQIFREAEFTRTLKKQYSSTKVWKYPSNHGAALWHHAALGACPGTPLVRCCAAHAVPLPLKIRAAMYSCRGTLGLGAAGVMALMAMAYVVMACVVMACVVMAHVAMAIIVAADVGDVGSPLPQPPRRVVSAVEATGDYRKPGKDFNQNLENQKNSSKWIRGSPWKSWFFVLQPDRFQKMNFMK